MLIFCSECLEGVEHLAWVYIPFGEINLKGICERRNKVFD